MEQRRKEEREEGKKGEEKVKTIRLGPKSGREIFTTLDIGKISKKNMPILMPI